MVKRFVMALGMIEDEENIALVLNNWPIGQVWSLPGGRLEEGEALQDCCVREVQEETGLLVAPVELAFVIDAHNQVHNAQFLCHVFSCRVVTGALRTPRNDEFVMDVKWVKREDVARYITWPIYRDPLLAYLAGHEGKRYWLDRDAYRPEEGKGPKPEEA